MQNRCFWWAGLYLWPGGGDPGSSCPVALPSARTFRVKRIGEGAPAPCKLSPGNIYYFHSHVIGRAFHVAAPWRSLGCIIAARRHLPGRRPGCRRTPLVLAPQLAASVTGGWFQHFVKHRYNVSGVFLWPSVLLWGLQTFPIKSFVVNILGFFFTRSLSRLVNPVILVGKLP